MMRNGRAQKRRWKALRDFGSDAKTQEQALEEWRQRLQSNDGQSVKTFVADHWTLEYDLAFCGLAEEVYVAASLAMNDDPLNEEKKERADVEADARTDLQGNAGGGQRGPCGLCAPGLPTIPFRRASKAIAAQYLAEALASAGEAVGFDKAAFAAKLPRYIVEADCACSTFRFRRSPASEKGNGNA